MRLKHILLIVLLAAVVAIFSLLSISYIYPANTIKAKLEQTINDSTGLVLNIEELRWEIGLLPKLAYKNLEVSTKDLGVLRLRSTKGVASFSLWSLIKLESFSHVLIEEAQIDIISGEAFVERLVNLKSEKWDKLKVSPTLLPLVFAGFSSNWNIELKKGNLKINSLDNTEQLSFDPFEFFISITKSDLKVPYLRALSQFGDIIVGGEMDLKNKNQWKLSISLHDLDLSKAHLLLTQKLKGQSDGKAEIKMNVTSSAPEGGIAGDGQVEIKSAKVYALKDLKKLTDRLKKDKLFSHRFQNISLDERVRSGRINFSLLSLEDINIESAQMDFEASPITLTAQGKIKNARELFIDGHILANIGDVPSHIKAADGRAKVPIRLVGPIQNPKIDVNVTVRSLVSAFASEDGAKLINEELRRLKEKVKDKDIKKILDKLPDNIGDALKGIKF